MPIAILHALLMRRAARIWQFALLYNLRNSFPLHYVIFKQTASHLLHEGNSEQLFLRALSDSNGKMDPSRLAVWTSIGVNYSTFAPGWKNILKFSKGGKGKVHEDDLGLVDPCSTEATNGPCIEINEDRVTESL